MNKKVTTISITILLIAASMYLWKRYSKKEFFDPNKLNEPLKSYYFKLQEKGYNPKTNPTTHKNPFVTFSIGEADTKKVITVNNIGLVLIYENNKSFEPIKYNGEDFTKNGQIVSDKSDLFEGILEIIENKYYS